MAEEQLEQFREACCNKCMPSQSEEHANEESRTMQIEEHSGEDEDTDSDSTLSIEETEKQDSDTHGSSSSTKCYCLNDFKKGTYYIF